MEMNQTAQAARPSERSDRFRENMARGNLVALILLLIQYGLGMGVNLYVTLPAAGSGGRDIGKAFTSGPALAVHAVRGLLLVLMALSMIVRAVIARHRASIVTSVVGLVFIGAAAGDGVSFVHNSTNGASFGMALATGLAMLSYAIGLFLARRPAAREAP
jgi:hypothetical protein